MRTARAQVLGPLALAALAAALLWANACMPPPPPHFRRPVMAPQVQEPYRTGLNVQAGFNAQGVPPRPARGYYQASGFETSGFEGDFMVRVGLPGDWELYGGLGAPDIIPLIGTRWQILGSPLKPGLALTADAGFNAVTDGHLGLGLGGHFAGFEPFTNARIGVWRGASPDTRYVEGDAGLAYAWPDFRVLARYGYRRDLDSAATLAQGVGVAIEATVPRRRRKPYTYEPPVYRPPARAKQQGEQAGDVAGRRCAGLKPHDVFDPAQWELYGECLRLAGDVFGAQEVKAYAKTLREKPAFR